MGYSREVKTGSTCYSTFGGIVATGLCLEKQSHVERIIPNADTLLPPSELESFVLEAMAGGVSPIATSTGGLPGVVTRGVGG